MRTDDLYIHAKELLEAKEFRQARDLGHQLLKLRFSGAFEILAASFHGEGARDVALTVLENGVREAPEVWSLWLQLGNYLSEDGKLIEAEKAYLTARNLPHSEIDQIDFNEAVMRLRFGNRTKAMELFERVFQTTPDQRLRLVALTHRLTTMVELDQVTEALMELGEAFLHDSDNAELLTTLALKLLHHGDLINALNLSKQALGLKRSGKAAEVIRRIEGVPAEWCRRYLVTLQGRFEEESGIWTEFRKLSEVYAENEEEARGFALAFEPHDVRAELQVLKIEELEVLEKENKGVNWSSEPTPDEDVLFER